MANLRQDFGSATEWLFIGCGSSYYIGLAAQCHHRKKSTRHSSI
jgi:hypothetical protein